MAFSVSLLTILRRPRLAVDRDVLRSHSVRERRPGLRPAKATARLVASIVAVGIGTLALLSLIPIPDGPARLGLPALSVDAPTVSSPGGLALPDGSPTIGGAESDRGMAGGVAGYPGFTEALDTRVRGTLGGEPVELAADVRIAVLDADGAVLGYRDRGGYLVDPVTADTIAISVQQIID